MREDASELGAALVDPFGRRGDRDAGTEAAEQSRRGEADPLGAPAAADERVAPVQRERRRDVYQLPSGDGGNGTEAGWIT